MDYFTSIITTQVGVVTDNSGRQHHWFSITAIRRQCKAQEVCKMLTSIPYIEGTALNIVIS